MRLFLSSPLLGCTVLSVCGNALERLLLQAIAVSLFIWCFNKELDLTLFTHCLCKQPQRLTHHSHLHFLLFLIVVCWSSCFLYRLIKPLALTLHPHPITSFTSFSGCEGISAVILVFSRQCSADIGLTFLGRGHLGLTDLRPETPG